MNKYFLLPLLIIKFWYVDSVVSLFGFFVSLNRTFLQLFSLPLFVKTFFKPLKNEYRQGLVGFSRAMGIVIKTIFILVDLFIFWVVLLSEGFVFVMYLAFPILTIGIFFMK